MYEILKRKGRNYDKTFTVIHVHVQTYLNLPQTSECCFGLLRVFVNASISVV